MNKEIIHIVNESFSLQTTDDDLILLLAERINHLLVHDFNKLIAVLYRADINEKKLNTLLAENKNTEAGKLIAVLFVERRLEKIKSREKYSTDRDTSVDDNERW